MRDYNRVAWDAKTQRPYESLADRGLDLLIGVGALRLAGRFFIGRKDDGSGGSNGGGGPGLGAETKDATKKLVQPIPIPVKKDIDFDIFNR